MTSTEQYNVIVQCTFFSKQIEQSSVKVNIVWQDYLLYIAVQKRISMTPQNFKFNDHLKQASLSPNRKYFTSSKHDRQHLALKEMKLSTKDLLHIHFCEARTW